MNRETRSSQSSWQQSKNTQSSQQKRHSARRSASSSRSTPRRNNSSHGDQRGRYNRVRAQLQWGLLGCGQFAQKTVLPTFIRLRDQRVEGIYSHSYDHVKRIALRNRIPIYSSDPESIISNEKIKAVYITSRTSDHFSQAKAVIKAGKPLLIEKPMTVKSKDAAKLEKAALKAQVPVMIGFCYRWYPPVQKAKETIVSGMLGDIIDINITYCIDYPQEKHWTQINPQSAGGGVTMEIGTHCIDLIRYLGGEIEEVYGQRASRFYKTDADDVMSAQFRLHSGTFARVLVSFQSIGQTNDIIIQGTKGYLVIPHFTRYRGESFLKGKDARHRIHERFRPVNIHQRMLIGFQRALDNNEPMPVTPTDGRLNLQVIERIKKIK